MDLCSIADRFFFLFISFKLSGTAGGGGAGSWSVLYWNIDIWKVDLNFFFFCLNRQIESQKWFCRFPILCQFDLIYCYMHDPMAMNCTILNLFWISTKKIYRNCAVQTSYLYKGTAVGKSVWAVMQL